MEIVYSASKATSHAARVYRLFRANPFHPSLEFDKSAKGADVRRQTIEELASSSGGALATATVLRVFLKSGAPAWGGTNGKGTSRVTNEWTYFLDVAHSFLSTT